MNSPSNNVFTGQIIGKSADLHPKLEVHNLSKTFIDKSVKQKRGQKEAKLLVLDDINFKLEMKKIDQAICRTVENVVLMITMGATPDKGGINPRNMHAMQSLFTNQSVGRVLVSDYTTKADFIIPDLQKVIGPSKYDVINQDIKEGLQNAMLGEEKFANATIKAQLFLQRLHESREAFLKEFLQPEIDQICKNYSRIQR